MNTQVKISSNEGGIFTTQNNRITFTIPAGTGSYDLSEGYINLMCSVPIASEEERKSAAAGVTTAANPFLPGDANVVLSSANLHGAGVYIPNVRFQRDNNSVDPQYFPNSAIVKHVSMRSQTRGTIEHIKRNDILTGNLKQYSTGKDAEISTSYNDLFRAQNTNVGSKGSVFTDLNKEGTIVSRNLERQPVMIPLKDMLNFCNVKQYSTDTYGDTKIQLELDLSRIRVQQVHGQDRNFNLANGVDGFQVDQGRQNLFQMLDLTATIGSDMTQLMVALNDNDNSVYKTNATTYRPFNRIDDVPFHVGMKLNIAGTYTKNAAAAGDDSNRDATVNDGATFVLTRRIKEIKYNRGENDGSKGIAGTPNAVGSVILVLDEPLLPGASLTLGGTITSIVVRGAVCTFNPEPLQVDFAELVVTQLSPQNVKPDNGAPIQYSTFETEEFTQPQSASLNRMFECPPNCSNLFIFNSGREAGEASGRVASAQERFTSYRLRVDNEDTSDRDIQLKSSNAGDALSAKADPLHVQKQIVALRNARKPVKNLSEQRALTNYLGAYFRNGYDTESTGNSGSFMIAQVLPLTQNPKQVQLNLTSAAADIGRLTLFKEVVKSV